SWKLFKARPSFSAVRGGATHFFLPLSMIWRSSFLIPRKAPLVVHWNSSLPWLGSHLRKYVLAFIPAQFIVNPAVTLLKFPESASRLLDRSWSVGTQVTFWLPMRLPIC